MQCIHEHCHRAGGDRSRDQSKQNSGWDILRHCDVEVSPLTSGSRDLPRLAGVLENPAAAMMLAPLRRQQDPGGLIQRLLPLTLWYRIGHDARAHVEAGDAALDDDSANGNGEAALSAEAEPADGPGVEAAREA